MPVREWHTVTSSAFGFPQRKPHRSLGQNQKGSSNNASMHSWEQSSGLNSLCIHHHSSAVMWYRPLQGAKTLTAVSQQGRPQGWGRVEGRALIAGSAPLLLLLPGRTHSVQCYLAPWGAKRSIKQHRRYSTQQTLLKEECLEPSFHAISRVNGSHRVLLGITYSCC